MKKIKRMAALLLIFLLAAQLIACTGQNEEEESEETTQEETETAAQSSVTLSLSETEIDYGTAVVFLEAAEDESSEASDDESSGSPDEDSSDEESEDASEEADGQEEASDDEASQQEDGASVVITVELEEIASWEIEKVTDFTPYAASETGEESEAETEESEAGTDESEGAAGDAHESTDEDDFEAWVIDGTGVLFNALGTFVIRIAAVDNYGNRVRASVKVTVSDLSAPELSVPDSFEIEEGESVDFAEGVSAADAVDGDLTELIEIDSSQADTETAGTYTIKYSVSDSAGNTSSAQVTLTVTEPETQEETTTVSADSGSSSSGSDTLSDSQKLALATEVAQEIADYVNSCYPDGTDLEKVSLAAYIVYGYCCAATYTSSDSDYQTAYGVFIKGVYTCAGSTRALGLVLTCMGYSWTHENEHLYTHQWCVLTMDGQTGWADGMIGMAGYGSHPYVE